MEYDLSTGAEPYAEKAGFRYKDIWGASRGSTAGRGQRYYHMQKIKKPVDIPPYCCKIHLHCNGASKYLSPTPHYN